MNTCSEATRGRKSGQTELGTISQSELKDILQKHREWLETGGKEGARANLSNLNLVGLDFQGSNLRKAILRHSDFSGVDLTNADLGQADLRGSQFAGADLSDADLTEVRSLNEEQLACTDLFNAKLPNHLTTFEGLKRVEEVTAQAKTIMVATLGACLFSLLTITSASHLDLIKNTLNSKVPTVDINVDIGRFFWVVPPVLLALYLYFHLTLQNLWCYAAKLPDVFQDGLTFNRKVSPWLLNVIFEKWRPTANTTASVYSRLGFYLSILVAWLIVPITQLFFWAQYLVEHDIVASLWLTLIVALTFFFGVDSFLTAKSILKCEEFLATRYEGDSIPKGCARDWKQRFLMPIVSTFVVVVVLMGLVCSTIYGDPDWLDQYVLRFPKDFRNPNQSDSGGAKKTEISSNMLVKWLDKIFFADLRGMDVSVKEEGWKEYEDRIRNNKNERPPDESSGNDRGSDSDYRHPPVKPALLNRRNLRGVNAAGAFLVRAELRDADLRKARFYSAETKTNMEEAILTNANLQGADLRNCQLRRAYLDGKTSLESADLSHADLAGANLTSADLTKVMAIKTILCHADLTGANLEGVNLTRAKLVKTTFNKAKFHKAILKEADFTGADISESDLEGAQEFTQEQLDTTCCDRQSKLPAGQGLKLDCKKCLENKKQKKCEGKSEDKDSSKSVTP